MCWGATVKGQGVAAHPDRDCWDGLALPSVASTPGEGPGGRVGWGGSCCVLELVTTRLIIMIYIDWLFYEIVGVAIRNDAKH